MAKSTTPKKTKKQGTNSRVTWTKPAITHFLRLMAVKRACAGDGGSFKMSVFNEVAGLLNDALGMTGKVKFTGKSLWNKWKRMRPIQQAIGVIVNRSGWPSYTLAGGANITPELTPAWATFILTHPAAEPYKNEGWEWYDAMCEIVPVKVTGKNVFHPGQEGNGDEAGLDSDSAPPSAPSTPVRHSPAAQRTPSPAVDSDEEEEEEGGELPQVVPVPQKKRKAAAAPVKAKRARTSGRTSASAAFMDKATEEMSRMNDMMESFLGGSGSGDGGASATPARRREAMVRAQKLEKWLGTIDMVTLIGIFQRDVAAADAYMILEDEELRKAWVERAIELVNAKDCL